ncbi:MAG: ribbon-helix-helix domain-containing protein [Gemmatimonadetes bacterium]|nr:ribbon-helix-helix domain-containing protein [Gemmatimonadota bacterium]
MKSKIVITLDEKIVKQLDYLIMQQAYKNRSQAIEEAVSEKLDRLKRGRLARECAKLDPVEEQELAEEGYVEDANNRSGYDIE